MYEKRDPLSHWSYKPDIMALILYMNWWEPCRDVNENRSHECIQQQLTKCLVYWYLLRYAFHIIAKPYPSICWKYSDRLNSCARRAHNTCCNNDMSSSGVTEVWRTFQMKGAFRRHLRTWRLWIMSIPDVPCKMSVLRALCYWESSSTITAWA